jgi:hypothetical protein
MAEFWGNYRNLLAFVLLSNAYLVMAAGKEVRVLEIPDERHAALTVERGLYGLFPTENAVFVFPGKTDRFVRIPVNLSAKHRDERFGKLTDQTKFPILDAKYPGDWRGMFESGDRIVLVDSSMLQLLLLRKKDYRTVMSATVPTDILKPAMDRGGEPTTIETASTRKKFLAASRKIFGTKYTGFAEMPGNWMDDGNRNFLLASRVPGFPLLVLGCRKNEDLSCMVSRHCFLEDGNPVAPESVTGVAVSPVDRLIAIGDSSSNTIRLYKFNSCFDVRYSRSVRLPDRLPKLTNIQIDSKGRLWVTTAIPDSFTDSNLFFWEKDQWN